MIVFLLLSGFVCGDIFSQTTDNKKLTPRDIAQKTLPSTVSLTMRSTNSELIKTGSGFFVSADVVVTNYHVIEGATEGFVKIYGQDKLYIIEGTVGIDEKNDLALLKIQGTKGMPLSLNLDDAAAIGDEVFTIGNPKGLEGTFSQGIVSSLRRSETRNLIQITASISPGSSGGAVMNNKGEVIGVAVGAIESGQSLNFAVPVEFVHSLNSKLRPVTPLNTGRRGSAVSHSLVLNEPVLGATFKNSNDVEFVWVPPGYFDIGSGNYEWEVPVTRVHIRRGFWMGRFEITQGQWGKIMATSLAQQREKATLKVKMKNGGEGPDYPMYYVSWDDAKLFINKLNMAKDGFEYSLPSEAQWEYAARGRTTGEFYADLEAIGWYEKNSRKAPQVVGKKAPNVFGLYDIIGNVGEWCEDLFNPTYFNHPANETAVTTVGQSNERVLRGGAWGFDKFNARVSGRNRNIPSFRSPYIGFRIIARPNGR